MALRYLCRAVEGVDACSAGVERRAGGRVLLVVAADLDLVVGHVQREAAGGLLAQRLVVDGRAEHRSEAARGDQRRDRAVPELDDVEAVESYVEVGDPNDEDEGREDERDGDEQRTE